jgi:molybdopterin-guanine dinucleotide biosynthesis protein B
MQRIHIVGRKNHGKTQLVVELVEEFTRRGLRVGTIKHTHHRHELDRPGKDSHRHRTSGSAVVGVLSQGMSAVFVPTPPATAAQDRYAAMSPMFAGCDIVLVEGDTLADAPKIEVWRAVQQTAPLAAEDAAILAVVTDDALDVTAPLLPRSDVPRLADWLLARVARPAKA